MMETRSQSDSSAFVPPQSYSITLLDRYPTPFGLVRYGVAPDHPEVKNVTKEFERILQQENINFIGNVTVGGAKGSGVSIQELREMFDVVILSYGADNERKLWIPNEDLIESARDFVHFYNGLPDAEKREQMRVKYAKMLKKARNVVVIGQGNVALDVSRMLAKSLDELKEYDVTDDALEVLGESHVERIQVVGRRGPVQAACTTKELRELTRLQEAHLHVDAKDLKLDDNSTEELERIGRVKKRMLKVMEACTEEDPQKKTTIQLRFLRSPTEALKNDDGTLRGIRFEKNHLVRDEKTGRISAKGTGEFEDIECDVAFRSVGYKSSVIPDVPFDEFRGIVPNLKGRVTEESSPSRGEDNNAKDDSNPAIVPAMYVSGWLKRGPTGVILMNIVDSQETVASIQQDIESGKIRARHNPENAQKDHEDFVDYLRSRKARIVTYDDYQILERHEEEQGRLKQKLRDKVLTVDEMLEVIEAYKARHGEGDNQVEAKAAGTKQSHEQL